MKFNLVARYLLLLGLALTTGCAASGTPFQRIGDIPKDKGLVYVYRPNSIIGSAVRYDVHANNEVICTLVRGGYCLYYAMPGEVELWGQTESKGTITIDVKAGQEHFIKGSLSFGLVVGRPNLTLMVPPEALNEISDCKLINGPTAQSNDGKKVEQKAQE
jgi:hypothetical protein